MAPLIQLLVFRFGPDASFEGALLGALERVEAGSAIRIVDLVFARRDADSGELELLARGTGESPGAEVSFRLDPAERRRVSAQALERRPGLAALGDELAPGSAVAAVLLEHRWAEAISDAVERAGGERVAAEFVAGRTLEDLQAGISARMA